MACLASQTLPRTVWACPTPPLTTHELIITALTSTSRYAWRSRGEEGKAKSGSGEGPGLVPLGCPQGLCQGKGSGQRRPSSLSSGGLAGLEAVGRRLASYAMSPRGFPSLLPCKCRASLLGKPWGFADFLGSGRGLPFSGCLSCFLTSLPFEVGQIQPLLSSPLAAVLEKRRANTSCR